MCIKFTLIYFWIRKYVELFFSFFRLCRIIFLFPPIFFWFFCLHKLFSRLFKLFSAYSTFFSAFSIILFLLFSNIFFPAFSNLFFLLFQTFFMPFQTYFIAFPNFWFLLFQTFCFHLPYRPISLFGHCLMLLSALVHQHVTKSTVRFIFAKYI